MKQTLLALALLATPVAALAQGVVPTITVIPPIASPTDRSGTVALGGVAQTIAPANSARLGFCFQNQSAADEWINNLGAASPSEPSKWFPPGAHECFAARFLGAVSVYGAATGQSFWAQEW